QGPNHSDCSQIELSEPGDALWAISPFPPLRHFLEHFGRAALARRCGERLGIIAHRLHRLAPAHLYTGNYEITNNLWPLISTHLGLQCCWHFLPEGSRSVANLRERQS